ncbi:MAG: type II toxin-antitoxin system PemK/MazF family toxin [Eubacteriales bacterium]
MKEILLQRGQVYFAHLGVALGSEQGGTRPVLVVQNNKGNCHSPTVVVVPITSQIKAPLPTHVKLTKVPRLIPTSCALVEQIRTIDRGRLSTYLGKVPPFLMLKINEALRVSMGLDPEYN